MFEVRPFLIAFCRFLFQANVACFNEIHQDVNDLVFRDKVEQSTSVKLFFDLELTKFFFMASNFSVIPIRWLLTVDSEMAFFPFPCAR